MNFFVVGVDSLPDNVSDQQLADAIGKGIHKKAPLASVTVMKVDDPAAEAAYRQQIEESR